jgi:type II secretory pathway pseudopilin PulG
MIEPMLAWAATTTAIVVAIVGAIASAAGTAVAISSQKAAGEAANDAAKYNAKLAENNAIMASQQARFKADQQKRRNRLVLGSQRANFLKSGATIEGTPDDVLYNSSIEAELDQAAILYQGEVSSRGLQARARLSEYEGKQAQSAGNIAAAGSLLSGVGSAASYGGKINNAVNFD